MDVRSAIKFLDEPDSEEVDTQEMIKLYADQPARSCIKHAQEKSRTVCEGQNVLSRQKICDPIK